MKHQEYGPNEAGPLGSATTSFVKNLGFLVANLGEVGTTNREGNLRLLFRDVEHGRWLFEQSLEFSSLKVQRAELLAACFLAIEAYRGAKIVGLISRESALSFATANVQ